MSSSSAFPAAFVSHGAPTLLLEDVPARDFLSGFGTELGDYFLSVLAALGARSAQRPGTRVHASTTYGVLAMDAYRFD